MRDYIIQRRRLTTNFRCLLKFFSGKVVDRHLYKISSLKILRSECRVSAPGRGLRVGRSADCWGGSPWESSWRCGRQFKKSRLIAEPNCRWNKSVAHVPTSLWADLRRPWLLTQPASPLSTISPCACTKLIKVNNPLLENPQRSWHYVSASCH